VAAAAGTAAAGGKITVPAAMMHAADEYHVPDIPDGGRY